MLDILSPLRGYIAQSLQFYLGKYIEDIQLEGLGLFGGDLVLNDLEIKRHVLRESLEIPSSFDFSRGFIRELRIHIPWTQLLSQPIEVKLYTIELILTAKRDDKQRGTSLDTALKTDAEAPEDKIEQPKSGWIHETLQKILANVSVQVNNLVLKYEHDDVVFSIALGTLDFYSASESDGWKRSFEELGPNKRAICKRLDAKDVTIFLDRYTSEGETKDAVRRKVVGYEVPVLSRTSASVRAKLMLFSSGAVKVPDGRRSRPTSPLHQQLSVGNGVSRDEENIMDVDGLFAYRPSVVCDPFYSYSCSRSRVRPLYEVDIFIGELLFSVSDRQLEMLNQLIKSASRKINQANEMTPERHKVDASNEVVLGTKSEPISAPVAPALVFQGGPIEEIKESSATKKQESWLGWAMNALGTAGDEEEDELVSELLAETRGALLKVQPPISNADEDLLAFNEPAIKTSCVRLCISSTSLTLRKHESEEQDVEHQHSTAAESEEELVPVANLGMVKIPLQTRKRKAVRPAVPILHLSLSYSALEILLARGEEQSGMDIVLEIEKVELTSATASDSREDSKCKKGKALLTWGSIDTSHFSDCISHPYFINSFFGEEARRLNQRETRSFEIVKVSLDADIPVWRTLEVTRGVTDSDENLNSECECFTVWNDETIRCISITTITEICQQTISTIGIKERVLDGGILSNAVSTAWAANGFPISISEGMAQALSSIAEEYRIHRDPDTGAANLVQLLQPQLIALFSRHALHSCSAASPREPPASNVRHRSVHSALRLRFASTSTSIDREETSHSGDLRDESLSTVLDVSIGAAQAVLEPPKCLEIMNALSIILHRTKDCDHTSEEGPVESMLEEAPPSCQSIVQSDTKLVTISNVHIRVPDIHRQPEGDEGRENTCGDLSVIVRDFAWSGSFHPGTSKNRLQLGAAFAQQGLIIPECTSPAPIRLVEALGFELLFAESSADGGDNDKISAKLGKLMIGASSPAIDKAASVVDGLLSALGHPITWEPMHLISKAPMCFQIEVCGTSFTKTVSHRPRLVMAQRQSLHTEIASASVSQKRLLRDSDVYRTIFQGGATPMAIQQLGTSTPLFKLDMVQEKASGLLRAVPLLGSIGLFPLNPGLLPTTCAQCQIVFNVQLDRVDVELKGVSQIIVVVLDLVKRITANVPAGKELSTSDEEGGQLTDSTDSVLTEWSFIIDLKAAGGIVSINEALQLNIPRVSISSVDMEMIRPNHVKSGGDLKLVCRMEDITLDVSENGALKGMADRGILAVRGITASVDFSHRIVDNQHAYAIDGSLNVSNVEASLSRLKIRYLLKTPFSQTQPQPHKPLSQPKEAMKAEATTQIRWHWRMGVQLGLIQLSCTSDINHRSNNDNKLVHVVVLGKVRNTCIATRLGNHHPTKHLEPSSVCSGFTDIQISVSDIQAVERLQSAREQTVNDFGDFSRLPEHAFLGVLVCLGLSDLKRLSKTLRVSNTGTMEQALPLAMQSWHLTSSIAKMFQDTRAEWQKRRAEGNSSVAEIPLVVSWNDSTVAKPTHSFPLLSAFYRNYNEAGLPHHVIAGSIESADLALTSSSLYCLAEVFGKFPTSVSTSKSFLDESNTESMESSNIPPPVEGQHPPDAAPRASLTNIEVSLLLNQLRLILPAESIMDAIISRQALVRGNMYLVLESLSVASAVRDEISLDGLGYPPFNSRVLPRRPTVQAQRFGESDLRVICKAGKLSGFVADLELNGLGICSTEELTLPGLFEEHIGRAAGCSARFSNVETFWSPLNITCTVEEESFAISESDESGVKTSVAVALTKVRLDLHKPSFDTMITRMAGVTQGIDALSRSFVPPSRAKLKTDLRSKPQEESDVIGHKYQRGVSFSCDGMELNMFEMSTSTHFRVGTIAIAHSLSTLAGSASVQYLSIGHRTNTDRNSAAQRGVSEEVVFGANADPSLWQLAVENYPEKLVAARWSFDEHTEGTLFLDVQAYQLHVSHHFILSMSRFARLEPIFAFSACNWERPASNYAVQTIERRPFVFQKRWNVKLLVAPSVLSYWRQNTTQEGRFGIWMTSGQLFASVGLGSDEMTRQLLSTNRQMVNEINRFVSVGTMEMMLNVDSFGVNTSDDLPPLEVHFQRNSVGSVPMHTSSTWQRFSKYISVVSEAQRLLHDCSARITGEQHRMLERIAVGGIEVCLVCTDISRSNIQAEINALCVKLSSFSLGAVMSLLTARADIDKKGETSFQDSPSSAKKDTSETSVQGPPVLESFNGESMDDFKSLRRLAEGRRPLPGELVLTEALLIETQSADSPLSSVVSTKAHIKIDPNNFNIQLGDVVAYLEDCNKPWGAEQRDPSVEQRSLPGLGNKTQSWMGMRWCYPIPRKICTIVASPVPIPPTGIPNGWPLWGWDQDQEDDKQRLCDIVCQLRCWDSKTACFVLVCEFYVPWESTLANAGRLEDAYEPGSFGELMSQWFDDDMEETRYRAKLFEFGSRRRTFSFDNALSSDNWELRWRSPLQSEQESENKQKRLVVNALLASSLQVHSVLDCDAYQRVLASVSLPQVTLSLSHVGSANDAHDIITAELNETAISCAASGSSNSRTLNMQISSAVQVYLDNMAQLLTVSVIPRTTVDAMIELSSKGLDVSTLVGPVSVYLNHTTMLVLSSIPRLLQKPSQPHTPEADSRLSSMRIKIVNYAGVDIWYRQEGTLECLLLAADSSAAYSWLSLANSPFYQLRFAMEDPHTTFMKKPIGDKKHGDNEQPLNEDSCWCDPCTIKGNAVTGRFFDSHGFLWVCVELSGLQTTVTLRSSLTFRNYCDFPVRFKLNGDVFERDCASSDELYKDTCIIHRSSYHHSNCISLDGSACTLSVSTHTDANISRVMAESVSSVEFGFKGGAWCSVETQNIIPGEFDLVKVSDDQAEGPKKTQCNFAVLRSENSGETSQYVWVKTCRVQCRTVLPTDFDPLQPQISRRYTWMEISLYPVVTLENTMDLPMELRFTQKATTVNVKLAPSSAKCLSAVNPFEPVNVQLQYEHCMPNAQNPRKSLSFLLECSTPVESQIFDFEDCRVIASFCNNDRPMIRIKTERVLSVANMTPNVLNVSIATQLGNQADLEAFEPCVERSVGFSMASNRLVISIAAIDDLTDLANWSPEVSLNVKGDAKPIVVPSIRAGLRSSASVYTLELQNTDGYLKLIIRPQVIVINSTSCDLKCVPTDGRGNALVDEEGSSFISGSNAGWCVPVCLHKEAKKRSITADVSSWLSSKLSRRPSEDLSSISKPALVARLSCSFRVSIVEEGYEWTEEIAVLLPKIPLQLSADGKLKIVEPPESSSAPQSAQNGLYPTPTTTTHRRRLLVRHRGFRHKMLTYTMTQKDKSIRIMFFVDHQPPVVIHNQWQNVLGFRNMSFPADPEGVGADFYLEYDWGLQVSTRQRGSKKEVAEEDLEADNNEPNAERKLLSDWFESSTQSLNNDGTLGTTSNERMRFQIGSPQYGWSNALWQVGGIQFASFSAQDESSTGQVSPTFLVMCFYRAGSWLISITCLEDPTHDVQASATPSLMLPSTASSITQERTVPAFLRIGVTMEELSLHYCDEHDPVRDANGMILYPEVLRATCDAVSIVFATAPDPPDVSRHSTRLGYLSHIRSYTTLFVEIENIEVGHFLQTCNFPRILYFPDAQASNSLLEFDRVKKHGKLRGLTEKLLGKQLPGAETASLTARAIYTDSWDPVGIPSYFHSIELKLSPAVLQVEDDILSYIHALIRPMLDALEGEAVIAAMSNGGGHLSIAPRKDAWSLLAYKSAAITKQRKVYIERFGISNIKVTITARVSIPVLNSFDGTPLHFGSTEMREVFSFPDQLYKDLAADYVADTIVRSPMLLMSLNIIGNPAGFLRSFSQGVRDLVEIPLAASRNGYSPWTLTKGVVGGVASFLGHTTAATLTSVSGFSYSISRTMDQLTLPSDQLRKRHYTRPTHLSSALADGLGSLGSSVVGAAAGVITTPIAVYKERQMQGLDTGIRNVVGGVGMGLVGIVARPMGGVASLVSLASDGLLYGMGGNRMPFNDSVSRFDARPNELLRYKLKVLPDTIGSLIFAHGVWVVPDENKLLVAEHDLDCISKEQLEASENESIRCLLLSADSMFRLVQVAVVCSNECLYVVGVSGAQNQSVLARTSLESIEAVEESLKEPTVFDLGVKTSVSVEWLRFRLPARQRRHLSHQLRLWLAEDAIL